MKKRIDYYLLPQHTDQLRFICQLTEKAYRDCRRIYIKAPSAAFVKELDNLLWTYRTESFIPHSVVNDSGMPVIISEQPVSEPIDIILSTDLSIPLPIEFCQRLLIIVDAHAAPLLKQHQQQLIDQSIETHVHDLIQRKAG